MKQISTIQIGKNGVSDNLIETIKVHFKHYQNIKVVFLKNFGRDKNKIKKQAEEIINILGNNYTYRIIGFIMIIKKWRKPMR